MPPSSFDGLLNRLTIAFSPARQIIVHCTNQAIVAQGACIVTHAGDAALVKPTGVHYEQIRFNTWDVRDEDVAQFLKIVRNPANQPVLLHCKHGSDRTGMMVAIYRIVEQGWSKEDAIAEMTQGGFGYHPIWSNLIRYIQKIDVAALKKI